MSTFVPAVDCVHNEHLCLNGNVLTRMDVGFDFHLGGGTPVSFSDLVLMAAAANAAFVAHILNLLSDATINQGTRVTVLDTETSPSFEHLDGSHFGGVGGSHAAPQLAVVVKFQTARRGPSGRGRIFIGCLSAGYFDAAGELTSAARSSILTGVEAYVAAVVGDTTWASYTPNQVVLSKFHVVTPRTPPVARGSAIVSDVEAYGVNTVARTQRRRVPRG